MSPRIWNVLIVLLACQVGARELAQEVSVGVDQRESLSVVVYDSNLGLVTDTRSEVLPGGLIELEFPGIAERLDTGSASLQAAQLDVIEQNFRFDLLSKNAILSRFVGRKLKYSRNVSDAGRYEKVLREGILLSADPEIVQFGDEVEIGPEGTISLGYLPKELKATPTLLWLVENGKTEKRVMTARYLTTGLTWRAEYELVLGRKDRGEFFGWAGVTNNSGADYRNAEVRLVSGVVNQVPSAPQIDRKIRALTQEMARAPAAPVPVGRDLYAFSVPRATTLLRRETKNLRLFSGRLVRVERQLVSVGNIQLQGDVVNSANAAVVYSFANARSGGAPLPQGIARVYRDTAEGRLFIGSAAAAYTSVDEDMVLETGTAFDVEIERASSGRRQQDNRSFLVEVTVTAHNRGRAREKLRLEERLPGAWELERETAKSRRQPGKGLVYELTIPAGELVTLTYVVRTRL